MAWPVNARTSAMLDAAQALYGATITATQGSPSMSVGASGTTHAGQGVVDVVGADLDAIVIALRQVGFAAWHRTPAQGFVPHVHAVAVGEPLLSDTAAQQVQAYFAGRNGLASNAVDDGPRTWVGVTWETYTGGTYVPPVTTPTPIPGRMWNQYPGDRSGSLLDASDGILAGSPTLDPPGDITFYAADLNTPVASVTLTAGDSIMLAALEDFDYGAPVDVTQGYWLLRYTGGGVLTVADSYDLGYNYPSVTPTWTTRAKVGDDTEGLAYYAFDPTMLDESHLYDDGWPLIRITCTSGTAVLDFIGLQVQTGSGYWIPDGEDEWSAGTAPTDRLLPYDPLDPTFYSSGSTITTATWTVDGTPVYQFQPLTPEMDEAFDVNTFGRQVGDESSLIDAEDAVEQRDANITAIGGGDLGVAEYSLQYDDGLALFVDPESWRSTLSETPQYWTTPGKTEFPTPPGLPPLGWRRTTTYEFLDDDTGILGWVVGPAEDPDALGEHVQISGDAQTATLYAQTFHEFVDATTFNQHVGTEIGSWDKATDDDLNLGGAYDGVQGTFPATEITTSDTLLILSLDSTIREAIDLRHTYPSGGTFGSIEGYTGAVVALVNIPVTPRYRVPGYRYEQPSFVQAPTFIPTITDPEDAPVLWLRQRQRNDGLGNSVTHAKGASSRQRSLRQRGYR